jgi:hypothetical protein
MSNLKHGFFKRGFMLCDRCVLNGKCESFAPGGECAVEKQTYDWLCSELFGQYALEGLADEVLVGRAAMYLIRIARAEVYEANVGVSDASAAWGSYIVSLDKGLRVLLKDLALTRSERKKLEKDDVLVDVDRLLNGLARRSRIEAKIMRVRSPVGLLIADWTVERPKLRSMIRGGKSGGNVKREKAAKNRH